MLEIEKEVEKMMADFWAGDIKVKIETMPGDAVLLESVSSLFF